MVITSNDNKFNQANIDFSFARTLKNIISTSGAGNVLSSGTERPNIDAELIAMIQSMVRSFGKESFENPKSGVELVVDERPEALLDPTELLGRKKPAAGKPMTFGESGCSTASIWPM